MRTFNVLASALLGRALQDAAPDTIIVIPGGRAALAAYKQERDPSLAAQLKKYTLVKYRLLRTLLDVPILTRETFEEQIASDPVEKSTRADDDVLGGFESLCAVTARRFPYVQKNNSYFKRIAFDILHFRGG